MAGPDGPGGGGGPIAWIGPAVAGLDGVSVTFVAPEDLEAVPPPTPGPGRGTREYDGFLGQPPGEPSPPDAAGPPVTALSYSSLAAYHRCGYRFYAERVLGLLARPGTGGGAGAEVSPGALSALERGTLVHALLERLDFRRPGVVTAAAIAAAAARVGPTVAPGGADAAQIIELVQRFAERRSVPPARAGHRRPAGGALRVPARPAAC